MIFRIRHERRGVHVHCRLFVGERDGAMAMCGKIVMRDQEFDEFRNMAWFIEFEPEETAR